MATKKDDTKTAKKDDAGKSKKQSAVKGKAAREADAATGKTKPGSDQAQASAEGKDKAPPSKTEVARTFLTEALTIARHLSVDQIIYVCDEGAPLDELAGRSVKKKAVVASPSDKLAVQAEELGLMHEIIPAYAFDRFEKIKIAMAACVSSGKTTDGMLVLCLVGQHASAVIDTCMVIRVGHHSDEQAALSSLLSGSEQSAQVLEAVLNIALSVGFEGIEGDPVGTIFVVGDSTAVMEKSKQLTLNPFQGYSEEERNIIDPKIRNAVKNFCLLDGAIIIREDGVLLAAGRYLRTPEDLELDLPLGLGTRNAAAMGVTKITDAISFVVSKTTGTVRAYKDGKLAVELKQPRRRT